MKNDELILDLAQRIVCDTMCDHISFENDGRLTIRFTSSELRSSQSQQEDYENTTHHHRTGCRRCRDLLDRAYSRLPRSLATKSR